MATSYSLEDNVVNDASIHGVPVDQQSASHASIPYGQIMEPPSPQGGEKDTFTQVIAILEFCRVGVDYDY